jgi:hypothetical protein
MLALLIMTKSTGKARTAGSPAESSATLRAALAVLAAL